jgi:hypothetical protein
MKRRDFLTKSSTGLAGLAGAAMLPVLGRSATPCPPPTVSVNGGAAVATGCATGNAAQDWAARTTGPGVVWFHNFDTAAEVNNFRFVRGQGTDVSAKFANANHCSWIADGFAGGGCVQITMPTGGQSAADWWRPFSALNAGGNGKSVADPAANGTLTRRTYDPTNVGEYNWTNGYYGHSSYASEDQYDGTDFYLQFRVKIAASRFAAGNPEGKLLYLDIAGPSPNGGDQEIVLQSAAGNDGVFSMYTKFGAVPPNYLDEPQGQRVTGSIAQPGGAYASTCKYPSNNSSTCWAFPKDEWVTMLVHIIPGRDGDTASSFSAAAADSTFANTGIEVWVARAGATTYTKIWSKLNYVWYFDPTRGFNAVKASSYTNGVNAVQGWTQCYTQVIFSKQFIPCPQV